MAGKPGRNFENRYLHKDGRVVHIMWSARWSEADQMRIAVARDVTERKRAQSLQSAVYEISEAAHGCNDLPELFQRIHLIIGANDTYSGDREGSGNVSAYILISMAAYGAATSSAPAPRCRAAAGTPKRRNWKRSAS